MVVYRITKQAWEDYGLIERSNRDHFTEILSRKGRFEDEEDAHDIAYLEHIICATAVSNPKQIESDISLQDLHRAYAISYPNTKNIFIAHDFYRGYVFNGSEEERVLLKLFSRGEYEREKAKHDLIDRRKNDRKSQIAVMSEGKARKAQKLEEQLKINDYKEMIRGKIRDRKSLRARLSVRPFA